MAPPASTVAIAALLEHREWVHRLARSMASDEAGADDLEQGAWLAAVRTPPRHAGSLGGWLSRVVKNLAKNGRRGAARRSAHERAAARPEGLRSAAEVVAEAEAHRRLVAAVMALGEPLRSTVLMRFFEGASPAEVAATMRVPVETVRSRTRRALERLRDDLGGAGGREAWLAALAPIVGWRPEALGAPAAAGTAAAGGSGAATATTITGATLMTGKTTVLVASVLALSAGYAGGRLAGPRESAAEPADVAVLAQRLEALEAGRSGGDAVPAAAGLEGASPAAGAAARAAGDGSQAGTASPDLARRVASLEADLAAARKTNAALVAWASGMGPAPRDLEAEAARLEKMTTEQLLAEVRRLSTARYPNAEEQARGNVRTIEACAAYLARPDAAARSEVLVTQGTTHLRDGAADKAEAALLEAQRIVPPGSKEARNAAYQLAMVASHRKDNRRAADILLGLARESEPAGGERTWLRYIATTYLALADEAQARADLRALLAEPGVEADPASKRWLDAAKKDLEKLEAAMGAR